MAKDGTNRGGARIGAGRPRKNENHEFQIPNPKEYLAAEQYKGKNRQPCGQTCAAQVYQDTFDFLTGCDCAEYVNPQLVENFAQMTARHVQAEQEISRTGLVAGHPTTGEPIISPLVRVSLEYLKAAQAAWYQIQAVVNEHAADSAFDAANILGGMNHDSDDED